MATSKACQIMSNSGTVPRSGGWSWSLLVSRTADVDCTCNTAWPRFPMGTAFQGHHSQINTFNTLKAAVVEDTLDSGAPLPDLHLLSCAACQPLTTAVSCVPAGGLRQHQWPPACPLQPTPTICTHGTCTLCCTGGTGEWMHTCVHTCVGGVRTCVVHVHQY